MRRVILVVIRTAPKNDDSISSRTSNEAYRDNWDRIFTKDQEQKALN